MSRKDCGNRGRWITTHRSCRRNAGRELPAWGEAGTARLVACVFPSCASQGVTCPCARGIRRTAIAQVTPNLDQRSDDYCEPLAQAGSRFLLFRMNPMQTFTAYTGYYLHRVAQHESSIKETSLERAATPWKRKKAGNGNSFRGSHRIRLVFLGLIRRAVVSGSAGLAPVNSCGMFFTILPLTGGQQARLRIRLLKSRSAPVKLSSSPALYALLLKMLKRIFLTKMSCFRKLPPLDLMGCRVQPSGRPAEREKFGHAGASVACGASRSSPIQTTRLVQARNTSRLHLALAIGFFVFTTTQPTTAMAAGMGVKRADYAR